MTLVFSIINERQIRMQHVQLNNRTGNRWLFRFPENRLESIIYKFRSACRGYRIHIVDGKSTSDKIIASYSSSRKHIKKLISDTQIRIKRGIGDLQDRKSVV